jgi:hypothetical protein
MDTTWIQVFVLTIAECVAPAGKTICQEQQLEMVFLTENDCKTALEQMLALKSAADNVIVSSESSRCTPSARSTAGYASLDEVTAAHGDKPGWRPPDAQESQPDFSEASHRERLDTMKSCEEANGIAPCKVGDIVIEAAAPGKPVEVWRRER